MTISIKTTAALLFAFLLTAGSAAAATVTASDGGTTAYSTSQGVAIDFDATPAPKAVWTTSLIGGQGYQLKSVALKNGTGNTGTYYLGVYTGLSGGVLSGFQGVSDNTRDLSASPNDWMLFTFSNLNHTVTVDSTVGAGSGLRYFVFQPGTSALATPNVVKSIDRFGTDTYMTNSLASVIAGGGLVAARSPQYVATVTPVSQATNPPTIAALRRPISPNQPMWLLHIDTPQYADPQKIIDLIPQDIRPYVVMNVSLSVGAQNGVYSTVEYPYETAKSWVRTCAENDMWCTVQVASGGYARFPDDDISQYEEFYRDYPNFIGFNYAEQFWGFGDIPRSPFWTDRVAHWVELMKLNQKYGGYLIVSWCGQGSGISPIAMFKKNPEFAAICQQSPQHFILTEKYTTGNAFQDTESVCLGSYLSGFSGNYGIRFDNGGWSNPYETNSTPYPTAVSAPPHLEHIMLTGETVIDGPELIWAQCFYESSAITTPDGYKARQFNTYSQFDNVSVDIFRKVLDGTVRIPSRQEVIDRTKVAIVNDVNSASDVDIYSAPTDLFLGLYQMDDDGSFGNNKSWFKKTGRYPSIPTVFQLSDATAQSFEVPVNRSSYPNRWPSMASKTNEFNSLFPQEYSGDMYAGRLENGWVVYNPYKSNQTASANIPFKYNTCDHMELTFDRFSSGVIKEYSNSVSFYLQNYAAASNSVLYTDTIKIYGSTSAPTWSYADRASHLASIVTSNWSGGVFTLTVQHNGALDITVNCAGTATSRLTNYTAATLVAPAAPPVYPGPRQYEGECFDYKNVAGNVVSGYNTGVSNYTGQGYLKFGTSSAASVRDLVSVLKTGTYRLETRYAVTNVSLSSIDLYVNGVKVATPTFTQTASYSDWAINKLNISLNAGTNTIEFRANAAGSSSLYFDNMVLVPTAYGDGIVVQEYQSGFGSVDGNIENNHSGYTGAGYANPTDASGAGIDWALNFDSSFTKSFTFRYAATADATADLYVNGTNVASNIQFKSTGSFSAWDYVTVYAEVPVGSADVRLQAVSSTGLPNVDSLEVIGGTPWYAGNVPFVPLGLTATSISISQINLAWSATPGAASYNVKRASVNGGPYTTIATGVTSPGFTNTGLPTLTTYYYVVSAVNVTGESTNSAPASATTKSTVTPPAPTGLSAVAVSYHQANLSWTGSLGVDYYIVKRSLTNGGPYLTVAVNVTGTNFSDTGLFAGKTYYYVVSGVNNNGEGLNSSQASTTTPSTFTMEPMDDAYVEAGSSVGSYFGTSDQLKVKNQGLDANVTRVTYLKFNVQNLSDATSVKLGLTPYQIDGTGITNRLELVTNDSWTERTIIWSNQPGGAGIVITNLRSSNYSLGNQILIDVTSNAVNQATNDGYLSLLIFDPYTNATLIGFWSKEALLTNTHPVLVSTLVQNHPAPATPTGLAATPVTDTRIDLSWTPASGASSYNVQRASVSGGPYTLIATGVSGTNYSDTGLSASTTYYYLVGAMNGAGASANSTQASATTHAFPLPAAPTSLTAVGVTTNRINLSWSTSSGAASYNIKRSLTNGGPYAVVATGVTASYFNDVGLAADTTYYYVVSALNSTGESANSVEASATTLAGVVTLVSSTTGLYPVTTGVGVAAGTFDLDDSANALVVGVYIDANNILCLTNLTTFGGVPPSGLIQASGGGGNRMFALYWLNPNTAPGQTLVIAANASADIQAGYYALQLAGVDTNAAVVKTGAATTDANNVNITTTTANSLVVSFYSANASGLTLTPTAPLTSLGATLNTINGGGGGSLAAGTNVLAPVGTQNLAWTSSGSTANQGVNGLAFAPYTGPLIVGPSGPEHLTNSYSASTGILSLSWPAGEGWRLQMQTNSLAAGLGTNWVHVTDGTVSSTNIPVNPANSTVFYRLVYP